MASRRPLFICISFIENKYVVLPYSTLVMEYYFYAILACLIVGTHLFAIKLISVKKEWFYPLMFFIIVTMLASRFYIYEAMRRISNPTLVHLILNMSVFVTFFASVYFLKLKDFDYRIFLLGIVFIVLGISCIQYSYNVK